MPAGAQLIVGGDYQAFMNAWDRSPMKRLAPTAILRNRTVNEWIDCWTDAKDVRFLGSLQRRDHTHRIRILFTGIEAAQLTRCANSGRIEWVADTDGTYLEFRGISDGFGTRSRIGAYLVADDTAAFVIDIGGVVPGATEFLADRKRFETDIAIASASSVVDSPTLKPLLVNADRSKSLWFAGSAEGTKMDDMFKRGYGWLDIETDAVTFRFSIEMADETMARQLIDVFSKAQYRFNEIPAIAFPGGQRAKNIVLSFIRRARMIRSGYTLMGNFVLTNDSLTVLMSLSSTLSTRDLP